MIIKGTFGDEGVEVDLNGRGGFVLTHTDERGELIEAAEFEAIKFGPSVEFEDLFEVRFSLYGVDGEKVVVGETLYSAAAIAVVVANSYGSNGGVR